MVAHNPRTDVVADLIASVVRLVESGQGVRVRINAHGDDYVDLTILPLPPGPDHPAEGRTGPPTPRRVTGLSRGRQVIVDYVEAHPGSTIEQIAEGTGSPLATVKTYEYELRKKGYLRRQGGKLHPTGKSSSKPLKRLKRRNQNQY